MGRQGGGGQHGWGESPPSRLPSCCPACCTAACYCPRAALPARLPSSCLLLTACCLLPATAFSQPASGLPPTPPRPSPACHCLPGWLQVMMRLKNVRHLDPRQGALVDSAYFEVKQPAKAAAARYTACWLHCLPVLRHTCLAPWLRLPLRRGTLAADCTACAITHLPGPPAPLASACLPGPCLGLCLLPSLDCVPPSLPSCALT